MTKLPFVLVGCLLGFNLLEFNSADGSIIPKNDLRITVEKLDSNVSEEQFRELISTLRSIYRRDALRSGATLFVHAFWNSTIVNAEAKRVKSNIWAVEIHGGIARHSVMNLEGLAVAVCHELGHHFGGKPKKHGGNSINWMSVEGQADYFATQKCLKRLLHEPEGAKLFSQNLSLRKLEMKTGEIPDIAKEACADLYSAPEDIDACIVSAVGARAITRLLHYLKKEPPTSEFETPDPEIVDATLSGYPSVQCRLDTFFQGALCFLADPIKGNKCEPIDQVSEETGLRPRCWYNRTK